MGSQCEGTRHKDLTHTAQRKADRKIRGGKMGELEETERGRAKRIANLRHYSLWNPQTEKSHMLVGIHIVREDELTVRAKVAGPD